jgi:hypothetical protein
MGDQFSFSLTGEKEIQEALRALPEKMQLYAIEPGVRKASQVIAKAMQAGAPWRTGLLKKSIGAIRPKIYYARHTVYCAVGPRRGFGRILVRGPSGVKAVTEKKAAKYAASGNWRARINPARYAHIIEAGRRAVVPVKRKALTIVGDSGVTALRKTSRAVAAFPFMARALASSRAAAFEALRAGIQDGLAKQLTKLTK